MALDLDALGDLPYCYLTTVGRTTGRERTVEIWFALRGATLYVLSGGGSRSNWVRNILRNPQVRVRLSEAVLPGTARLVQDGPEEPMARRLLLEKYQPTYGGDLSGWSRTSLPVAVDLADPA